MANQLLFGKKLIKTKTILKVAQIGEGRGRNLGNSLKIVEN